MKCQEHKKVGKVYKPTKRDTAPEKTVNWLSPVYWPTIEAAARQWVGKPNLTKLVAQLQRQDPRFSHLSHQRLSDWRDKTIKDRIVWSEETIALVQKGFLPGGHQTRYNVFVSIFKLFVI
jgi:hypothetical protein